MADNSRQGADTITPVTDRRLYGSRLERGLGAIIGVVDVDQSRYSTVAGSGVVKGRTRRCSTQREANSNLERSVFFERFLLRFCVMQ